MTVDELRKQLAPIALEACGSKDLTVLSISVILCTLMGILEKEGELNVNRGLLLQLTLYCGALINQELKVE